jgi:ribosome biogenesis protein BRX1
MASSSSSSTSTSTSFAARKNKHRVLLFGSRGMSSRDRHLIEDLRTLLVHNKKESKFDSKVSGLRYR